MIRSRVAGLAGAAVLAATGVLLVAGPVSADSAGTRMYTPTSGTESNAYARVIRLGHAGARNGTLLGTFEHWYEDGTPSAYLIRSSRDHGASWATLATVRDPQSGPGHPVSRMWQPSLFEFPRALGGWPAGTLLLVGNLVPADGSYTQFFSWRSTDHGRSWTPIGQVQRGGTFGKGIWEPFLHLDGRGRLAMAFSDERDSPRHSQMIVHVTSGDGGTHWGPVVRDVASRVAADRPGMPTVTRLGSGGNFVMSYEVCGRPNCATYLKRSGDGARWRAADIGQRVISTDGRYPGHSPYVTWLPGGGPQGQLMLAGQRVFSDVGNQPTGEDYRAVFLSTTGGRGPWSWAPAPWQVSNASPACNANYSPSLLPAADGTVRYTAPTSVSATGPCGEGTGTANIAGLPFHSMFGSRGQAGWDTYGGCWATRGGSYTVSCGGELGAKALTGSTGWSDYTVTAGVQLTSTQGDAGLLARVTDPAVGPDSHAGYLAALDRAAGTLTIARQQYAYEPLVTVTVPGGLSVGTWYRLAFTVRGAHLTATVRSASGGVTTRAAITDPYASFSHGMTGLRDHAGTATFRSVTVIRAGK